MASRVCVISDVHGSAGAFAAALESARALGPDRLILLGDLLTYGVEPREVLDLAHQSVERDGAILIEGNHDRLYHDLAHGRTGYLDRLPEWIRESVGWTVDRLSGQDLGAAYRWRQREIGDGVLYAHANPFPAGDWTYLNQAPEIARAALTIAADGLRVGVFGHTHRARLATVESWPMGNPATVAAKLGEVTELLDNDPGRGLIANAGSVGQPRCAGRASTFMLVERRRDGLHLSHRPVAYDVDAHVRAIGASGMSEQTRARLLGFFR